MAPSGTVTPMYKNHALVSAIGFFFCWLAVLYTGADHPPPRGFLWVVLLVFVCALVVHFRVPAYLAWICTRRPGRHVHVAVEGLIAGLVVAMILLLLPGGGEPSVTPTTVDRLIWFAVLGTIGMANSVAVYGANALYARYANRGRGFPS